ncbi:MAG TPA: NAD(P)-dependent oxidoreductase [Phycisphaerae bacterium]|nr:NAD(P)-dependent oxidoreductase [Phycisphaerae bacterium]
MTAFANQLPDRIESEEQLDDLLTTPTPALLKTIAGLRGDLVVLGVGGKMGPTLARLARRALDQAGLRFQVIGVDRFPEPEARERLEANGVKTVTADLLDREALDALPDAQDVIYMAGRKFGSTGQEELTWAMNVYLPAVVSERYRDARIAALSTGNVYPFMPATGPGPTEEHSVSPIGEYAQSCLGRERMLQYTSSRYGTKVTIIRLNYAIDLRYGVLVDVATKVLQGEPIDLAMGYANVIWQGDANVAILRALDHAAAPPFILNLTGAEIVSIRKAAEEFGRLFGKQPLLQGREAENALLNNPARYVQLMGGPTVPVERLIRWVAHWLTAGGRLLGKPTHYEARDGKF